MRQTTALLVIADISGYTRFMNFHATSLLHAEEIITELLEAVIDGMGYPLTIAKLEGDAVFMYAEVPRGEEAAAASSVQLQIGRMFDGFYARAQGLIGSRHGCICDACSKIGDLRLKMVVHYGTIAIKQIRGFTEVAGAEVILLHRLLKNSLQSKEYILMTPVAQKLLGDYQGQTAQRSTEQIDDFGSLNVYVYAPQISVDQAAVPSIRGTQVALRLNAHAIARLMRGAPAPAYHHLPSVGVSPRINIVTYLLEGLISRLVLLRESLRTQAAERSR